MKKWHTDSWREESEAVGGTIHSAQCDGIRDQRAPSAQRCGPFLSQTCTPFLLS